VPEGVSVKHIHVISLKRQRTTFRCNQPHAICHCLTSLWKYSDFLAKMGFTTLEEQSFLRD